MKICGIIVRGITGGDMTIQIITFIILVGLTVHVTVKAMNRKKPKIVSVIYLLLSTYMFYCILTKLWEWL